MAKSRAAGCAAAGLALLGGLATAAPAAAVGQDPEALVQQYQAELRAAVESNCNRDVPPGEIIVCGRREKDRFRVPPQPPEPGERVGLIAGELPSAVATLGADRCLRLCHQPLKIDIISAMRGIGRAIANIGDR